MTVHETLRKYFDSKRQSSPGFSLRALSSRLGVSPSYLSRILSGKKKLSLELLETLAGALDIDSEMLLALKKPLVAEKIERVAPPPPPNVAVELQDWELADKDSFRILRRWFYLPILDITSLTDFDGTLEYISRRFGLSLATTEIAVNELVSLGLLKIEDGRLKKTARKIRWSSARSLDGVRKFHGEMLLKAKNHMETVTEPDQFSRRLIMGITATASPEKIEAAKRKLNECLYEIANDLTSDAGTEVYHLAAQLFPLTEKP